MTTIIGQQHEWGCVVASDMQTTSGESRPFNGSHMAKQVERGDFIIAAGGNAGPCDYAMHIWKPPKVPLDVDVHLFLVRKVVPSLRAGLKKYLGYDLNDSPSATMTLLLAVHGEVFLIETDGTVMHHESGIYSVGSGGQYAVGALHAGCTVEAALSAAEHNDIYTSGPFTVHRQNKT
jgi:ATP-dependent protease HslVU (ClpYQ) peptidase subunit